MTSETSYGNWIGDGKSLSISLVIRQISQGLSKVLTRENNRSKRRH